MSVFLIFEGHFPCLPFPAESAILFTFMISEELGVNALRKTIGILAHVDAGKTTFSESVLYSAGAIRKKGRVDHQDTFLDTDPMEMARGITIFSGQAMFQWKDDCVYWLDTPGHADFSAEMERSISVMDAAILLVSAADGVQPHTETVWQLLEDYHVPVFIFLNKCDRSDVDQEAVIEQIRARLSPDVLDFRGYTGTMNDAQQEAVAGLDEDLMEHFFDRGYDPELWLARLKELISLRRCFPLMSGSALTGDGVSAFMDFAVRMSPGIVPETDTLQALVYRIRHDPGGQRLCFMKLLSGSIHLKDTLRILDTDEKVNDLRIYSGQKYHSVTEVDPGDLFAVPLNAPLHPGDTLGGTFAAQKHIQPMTSAELIWDRTLTPVYKMSAYMHILEDEEPSLSLAETNDHISVKVIGPLQLEILSQQIQDRFHIAVSFGPPRILYHETVASPVIGIGHYEPLRHYAEVHLRISPAPRGSGIHFRSFAHVDDLALNWQRLIATHVHEKEHKGVLTGSPLTDVYIDLLCGRAHLKHTEGGDFRQAVYRAIRNALMYADSVLLEPVCSFTLRIPSDLYGSIQGDLARIQADCNPPDYQGDTAVLKGTCVYSRFLSFQEQFSMKTHGNGALKVQLDHEQPCHNTDQVLQEYQYQPLADDTPNSVFCSHGAGFTVNWDHVHDFAHLETPTADTLTRETPLD